MLDTAFFLSGCEQKPKDVGPAPVMAVGSQWYGHIPSSGRILLGNRSRGYNARFTASHRTVSVYRVLQMRGDGYADVLHVFRPTTKQMRCPVNAYEIP